MLLIITVISLQFSAVQTFLTKRVAAFLSKELNADITLDRIYFKPFSSLEIVNFSWKDKFGNTIVSAHSVESTFVLNKLLNKKIEITEIIIEDGYLNFEIYKDSTNFSNAIAYFSSPRTGKVEKEKIKLTLNKIEFRNNQLKLVNHTLKHYNKGVDFSDLDIQEFSATFDDIEIDTLLKSTISDFHLKEKSGLIIRKLETKATVTNTYMEFGDLYLATNNSTLQDYLKFEYDSLEDFSNFINKVKIEANISSSKVSSRDIEFFAPSLKSVVFDTDIQKAKVAGTVSNIIVKDADLGTAKNTNLAGSFTVKGLPRINSTVFNFNLSTLQTTAEDIETIVTKLSNRKVFKLPQQLLELGTLDFSGSFVGLYNDFTVDGAFKTKLGDLTTSSKINIANILSYKGNIQSKDFQIGQLIQNNTFQKTAFNLDFNGADLNLEKLNLTFDGHLAHIRLADYTIEKLVLNGDIADKNLYLTAAVQDRNLELDFTSTIDWLVENPIYIVDAHIKHAALHELQLTRNDSIVIHNTSINANFVGSSLNTLTGQLHADSLKMSTSKGDFAISTIDFIASGNESNRTLALNSDILDINIFGQIDLHTIVPYFRSLAMRYAPAIALQTTAYNPQNFTLELKIKSFNPLSSLIDESLSLGDGTYLNADFSSDNYLASFIAFSPTVNYKGMKLTNLAIRESADNKAFSLEILADRLNFSDSTYINKIAINNVLADDSLKFNIEMSEKDATNYLNLNGNVHFAHNAPAYIKFQPSTIIINKEKWTFNAANQLRISKGKIYINNLRLNYGDQQIKLAGIVSNEDDKLDLDFNNFSLSSLNGITNPLGIKLNGDLNGNIQINSVLKNPYAAANIKTSPIIYNQLPIGQLSLEANFDPLSEKLSLDINLLDQDKRGIQLNGDYDLSNTSAPLNLKGKLKEVDLNILQPFLRNLISNLHGRTNADIRILGTLNNPLISGDAKFDKAEFTVNYLKTKFKVDNQFATAENNSIQLNNFLLNDPKDNQITANGFIDLSTLALPYIDIQTSANNVMILNTTFKDNNLYYGTVFATGDFNFKGFTNALAIDIKAKSETGTTINLPFNSAMKVSDSDFIYFVSKDSTENEKRVKNTSFNGITMNMDLNITPEAELNLQTNLGNLKGNGNGSIAMKISSLGDFEMFGDYVVSNGKFHFTAQDFINKYFDIKEGGQIQWTGKPSEANININAIYQQRTSISPLYNAAGRDGDDERVLAQADMIIKGTLEQPDISFDLNFPQNPYIKDQLQSFLSDANNVNQQALSLIVRRSFTPSTTEQIGREVNNTLLSAGTEIAFNQLNNIISQSLNLNFFDLNIRSFNDASASVRLWDDRLIFTGGIADRSNFQATDLTFFKEGITTDAELSFKLRQDGNLTLRAYNRPYTRNFLLRANDADNISAVGVVYRQEFNSLQEFWKKLWNWRGIKKEDKPKEKK